MIISRSRSSLSLLTLLTVLTEKKRIFSYVFRKNDLFIHILLFCRYTFFNLLLYFVTKGKSLGKNRF